MVPAGRTASALAPKPRAETVIPVPASSLHHPRFSAPRWLQWPARPRRAAGAARVPPTLFAPRLAHGACCAGQGRARGPGPRAALAHVAERLLRLRQALHRALRALPQRVLLLG